MAYTPTSWSNGGSPPLSAANLSKIEDAMAYAHDRLSTIQVTDSPTKPAEGLSASYFVTSAVSWPSGLVWSNDPDSGSAPVVYGTALVTLFTYNGLTRAVMGATFPALPDAVAPTAGTLASSSITASSFTLSVSGAADETQLAVLPYRFSTDGGTSYSAWQAGSTYSVGSLLFNTAYQCRHQVRDAYGNISTGSTLQVTTTTLGNSTETTLGAAILALSPVGYWPLNETSGTRANDRSGNARPGSYLGGFTLAGQSGVVTFDGSTGSVEVPTNAAWFIGTTGLTVFALARPTAFTANKQAIAAVGYNAAADRYAWGVMAGTTAVTLTDIWGPALAWSERTTTQAALTAAAWHTYAATFPGSAVAGAATPQYIDSSTARSDTSGSSGTVGVTSNGAPLRLGARTVKTTDGPFWFNGSLGHVAIFPRPLNTTEIGNLVTAARTDGWIA